MFVRLTKPTPELTAPPLFLVFFDNDLLVDSNFNFPSLSMDSFPTDTFNSPIFLGQFNNQPVYTVVANTNKSPDHQFTYIPFRDLYKNFDHSTFAMTNLASQICRWDRDHQYCGKCSTKLTTLPEEFGKACPSCHLTHYPTLSPAIIVVVKKEDKILLAQNYKWVESNMFSTLAGFVEPGETIENAVEREVMEEVGIKVKNIKYISSQSWPFPGTLMLGFSAEYDSGTIVPDGIEIKEAGWYGRNDLPATLPNKRAISRFLIETVMGPLPNQ
ncbi:MAG: NAD(+) diphosphatase [Lentisphaeria bacterium]|nr:NAD(+) diphosphatase [Lentisphaeria bacterium]